MSPARQADHDLDSLIEEITVDCYNEDEQLAAFENAFYDANFPCPGTVIGEDVEVLSVSMSNRRQELIATCQRDERRHELALLTTSPSRQTQPPYACSPRTAAGSATKAETTF
ncbi:MAG: hypothetical protein WBP81_05350 [Solirubrobacteraceae bacterium]